MDLGVCVATHVGDIDYVVRAEELGYSHAWFADSQMLWSDCYAALALAATRTSRIQLGTGVAVSGTRPAPVTAASIATINVLAPGRTFLGIGSGNTAMRVMGRKPHRIREFDRYLTTLRALLRGAEATGDDGRPIAHIMPDEGFVNFADPIPLYVSGFGPRSLGLAGKHGDGAVVAGTHLGAIRAMWQLIDAGAREAGRELDRGDCYTTALTAIVVLEEGEPIDSDRVKSQCGAMAMASIHYSYDQFRNFGHEPPSALANIWDDYTASMASYPEDRVHLHIHRGHNCWVVPEEEKYLTREVLESTCMIGTRDQLIERLGELSAEGLAQVMVLPNFDTRYEALEQVAGLIGEVG